MSGNSQVLRVVQELNISVLSQHGHPVRCICGHKRGGGKVYCEGKWGHAERC